MTVNTSSKPRRLPAIAAALLAVVLISWLPAAPASAAAADGWVRVAHLSPDTKQVDVTLTALAGGSTIYRLSDVGYGNVSPYIKLPSGTYAIAMRPAGASPTSTPVVTQSISVTPDGAQTVAAIGYNKDLKTYVFSDDFSDSSSKARVRVVQAAAGHSTATVSADGTELASAQTFASASDYSTVDSGSTSVKVTAGSADVTTSLSLPAGSVHTLFVLDTASGGVTVSSVLDSSGSAITPTGAIDTGAGGLAGAADGIAGGAAALAALGAAAAALAFARRPKADVRVQAWDGARTLQ